MLRARVGLKEVRGYRVKHGVVTGRTKQLTNIASKVVKLALHELERVEHSKRVLQKLTRIRGFERVLTQG